MNKKYLFLFLLIFSSIFVKGQSFDSCRYYRLKADTLLHKNYVLSKKLVKHNFYENICIKNPTQIKFLKGWQTRTNKMK